MSRMRDLQNQANAKRQRLQGRWACSTSISAPQLTRTQADTSAARRKLIIPFGEHGVGQDGTHHLEALANAAEQLEETGKRVPPARLLDFR